MRTSMWKTRILAAIASLLMAGGSLFAAEAIEGNVKVAPGKVKWHKDFQMACRAAAKSGKPVLLFQMMGNLDERFT